MVGSGMEKRNGTWTSQTRSRDAGDIKRLAFEIEKLSDDPQIREKAQRIIRKARDLENDL